ncbi:MAG TPA: hypothetical protein VFU71_17350 [Burkholderiaceae bacterium]|nr:hypothetical protein [Burkholderiaceae bacterium]
MNERIANVYWQLTTALLVAHLAGWDGALPLAVLLNIAQVNHFVIVRGSLTAFDVQVRIAYLALLALSEIELFGFVPALLLIGLVVRLLTDYCILARTLALLPWNRSVPLSWPLVRWLALSPPAAGSIVSRLQQGLAAAQPTGNGH